MNRRGLLRRLVGAPLAAILGVSALKEEGCAIKPKPPKMPVHGERLVGMDMGRAEFEADKVNMEVKSWSMDHHRRRFMGRPGGISGNWKIHGQNFFISMYQPIREVPSDWPSGYLQYQKVGKSEWAGTFITKDPKIHDKMRHIMESGIGTFQIEDWFEYSQLHKNRFYGSAMPQMISRCGRDGKMITFRGVGKLTVA